LMEAAGIEPARLDFLPHRANLRGQEATVPHLSPTTLTTNEQRLILRATAANIRDHTIISLALGTGLRLAEIVGVDVGDTDDARPLGLTSAWTHAASVNRCGRKPGASGTSTRSLIPSRLKARPTTGETAPTDSAPPFFL